MDGRTHTAIMAQAAHHVVSCTAATTIVWPLDRANHQHLFPLLLVRLNGRPPAACCAFPPPVSRSRIHCTTLPRLLEGPENARPTAADSALRAAGEDGHTQAHRRQHHVATNTLVQRGRGRRLHSLRPPMAGQGRADGGHGVQRSRCRHDVALPPRRRRLPPRLPPEAALPSGRASSSSHRPLAKADAHRCSTGVTGLGDPSHTHSRKERLSRLFGESATTDKLDSSPSRHAMYLIYPLPVRGYRDIM